MLNVSWNAFLPDGAQRRDGQRVRPRAPQRLAAVGHLVAGERHSGPAQLHGRRRRRAASAVGYFGTADVVGPSNSGGNALAPVYTCDPRLDGAKDVGEKMLDINCIAVPAFGENGDLVPPYNIRHADAA